MSESYAVNGRSGFDADYSVSASIKGEGAVKEFCANSKKRVSMTKPSRSFGKVLLYSDFFGIGKKKKKKAKRLQAANEILISLNDKWDLGQKFSVPGSGATGAVVEGLNLVFKRLNAFVTDLTKNTVGLGSMAPGMHNISNKVLSSAETLSLKGEEMESSCGSLAKEMRVTAESAGVALEKSENIVSEISRARNLSCSSLDKMTSIDRDMERLSSVISDLEEKSRNIGYIIETISDISDKTGLLSLNAFIESARAGSHGAGFGVIAQEIRQLSHQSGKAAQEIKESLVAIGSMIANTVSAVGTVRDCVSSGLLVSRDADFALSGVANEHYGFHGQLESVLSSVKDQEQSVSSMLSGIVEIAEAGRRGVRESRELGVFADRIRALAEKQLESSGSFILPQYRKVESEVQQIADHPDIKEITTNINVVMSEKISGLPYVELIYMTDVMGTQVSANVFRDRNMAENGFKAVGRNWANRDWFRKVKETGKNYISDVYRSDATGSYCMTFSVPVFRDGIFKGVIGADVNFENLLDI